jgi:hypothetical protein
VQARRDEEYAAIRAEREKERKARQAELAGDPFNKEVRPRQRLRTCAQSQCCALGLQAYLHCWMHAALACLSADSSSHKRC